MCKTDKKHAGKFDGKWFPPFKVPFAKFQVDQFDVRSRMFDQEHADFRNLDTSEANHSINPNLKKTRVLVSSGFLWFMYVYVVLNALNSILSRTLSSIFSNQFAVCRWSAKLVAMDDGCTGVLTDGLPSGPLGNRKVSNSWFQLHLNCVMSKKKGGEFQSQFQQLS